MLGMVPRPKQIRKSKLDILSKENFESIYRACKGNCAAVALAVKLMLQETQPEFSVSRSAVRRHLLSRYPELRPQKLDPVPFFVEPGQQLQIDFVQCEFRFTGHSEPTVLKVFEAVYSYSRRAFFLICPDLTQKSWLTGITQCLARWGIPRQILCDNDIGLVRRGVKPGEAKFNPRFQWLCDTIGVQSLVDTKQGFEIHTVEQLQAFVDQWLHQQADIPKYLIPNGRKVSENDLYAQEKTFSCVSGKAGITAAGCHLSADYPPQCGCLAARHQVSCFSPLCPAAGGSDLRRRRLFHYCPAKRTADFPQWNFS